MKESKNSVCMFKCIKCNEYTLKSKCPKCSAKTYKPEPVKFSLQDKYGEQRRKVLYGDSKDK